MTLLAALLLACRRASCFPQSTLPNFKQNEFSVVRQHEEFIWLHDSFVENEDYAGYIVRAFFISASLEVVLQSGSV